MNVNTSLSSHTRQSLFKKSGAEQFDALVIGGGITGAGIALDLSSRGLKVALIEKNDFAFGTSSRSTKLIHGGLRYLKQLELGLVKEVGRERAIVYKNASHIVHPEPMLLPILKNGSLSNFSASVALFVYDWLAGVKKEEKRRMLSARETIEFEPSLKNENILGGALYSEYRTDDARLVIEVLKTAASYGALSINYCRAKEFLYTNESVTGVEVVDELTGVTTKISAHYIVNATGPWVDLLREKDDSLNNKRLHHTKGVHIVVERSKLPVKQAIYFDAPEQRMVFAIPRGDVTYIGTTDTTYKADLDSPDISRKDVEYLLSATNAIFDNVSLTENDIISSWSGLRPLIHQEGKSPSELSRKDEIFISKSGLISIAGGKLTGYRMMAKRVADLICHKIESERRIDLPKSFTHKIILSGGETKPEIKKEFLFELLQKSQRGGIKQQHLNELFGKYGSNTGKIVDIALMEYDYLQKPEERLLMAELSYCVSNEMVITLNDFIIRRTGRMYFETTHLYDKAREVNDELQRLLKWPEEVKEKNWSNFVSEFYKTRNFN